MSIKDWSENVLLVDLPPEPEMCDELKVVLGMVRERQGCHVVIDFSDVDIVTANSLSQFCKLRKVMLNSGHRLILCGFAVVTRGIFNVTGLDEHFEFAPEKFSALVSLHMVT